MISESGLWWFVRIAIIISLNVNIRRYVCHSINIRDPITFKKRRNYIHNELGLTKEDIINAIRSDIRKYVEECICNTYGNDNNIEQMIKFMVDNELKNKDFNVIPRMVEKVLKDKMLNDIEIIIRNKNIND